MLRSSAPSRVRHVGAAVALAAAACSSSAPAIVAPASVAPTTAAAPAPAGPPRLVVLIVVDQLPAWSFERDRPALRHGFARLLSHGVYFPTGEYPYANTYTATGHATLVTGVPPRQHGILANRWYDRATHAMVDATSDPAIQTFAVADGTPSRPGQSSRFLAVPGISDALRDSTGGRGRSVAVSLKSRSAILAAGQRADLAVWYDDGQAAMTTSTAYAAALPGWLASFAREHPVASRFAEIWTPGDPALLERLARNPDDALGEGDSEGGLDHTFPHQASATPTPAEAFLATPGATDLLFDTAEAAIAGERLGADDVADYLSISVSSHDYAGHAWGQDSWERVDLLLRLDVRLGEFLDHLDRAVGAGRYAVVLTSDHGGVPIVEQSVAAGHPALRVHPGSIVRAAERGASRVLGRGTWIQGFQANSIYLSDAALARPAAARARAAAAIAREVAEVPGIGIAVPSDAFAAGCDAAGDLLRQLACASVSDRSGEVFAATAERSLPTDEPAGTGHGSPSALDRTVPIVVVAPGVAAHRDDRPTSMLRVAPTLARLLGVPPPAAARAPALDLAPAR